MRRHRPPGYHGGNLPGPGDLPGPPDEEELPEVFLDEARELLIDPDCVEMPTEQQIIDQAWELYEAAKKQSRDDAAEMRYLDKLDGYE